MTWVPLHEAFEHVLKHERSRELTEYRLRRVLGARKSGPQVRCRAGVVLTPMQRCPERENVLLSSDIWLVEVDGEAMPADVIVDWQESSARLPAWHLFAPWSAYRIEVCSEDLLAIWNAPPEHDEAYGVSAKKQQRKMEVAAIDRRIADRAAELRGHVSNPTTQAEADIARQLGRSAPALNKWRRRNR